MEYNSQKEKLIIPEYGRNIQNIIKEGKKIENKEMRTAFITKAADLIMQMHPHNKNLDDYVQKIWNHIFRLAGKDLDIDLPENILLNPEEKEDKKESLLAYPTKNIKFKHYGANIMNLIDKAVEMEDGPAKNEFINIIGSYMKLAYKTWNKEHYVNDELILSDLEKLSNGRLAVPKDAYFDNPKSTGNDQRKRRRNNGQHRSGKNGRSGDYRKSNNRSFKRRR
jgi:hypothetical protein